jgi:hypothetical protein
LRAFAEFGVVQPQSERDAIKLVTQRLQVLWPDFNTYITELRKFTLR